MQFVHLRLCYHISIFFFFFQAEEGIRDGHMTGVQTCALPISADSVIWLFMAGGMAHTETFDPKRYTPFSEEMDANEVLSTFQSIPTALDDVYFSEGLESMADRKSVV